LFFGAGSVSTLPASRAVTARIESAGGRHERRRPTN